MGNKRKTNPLQNLFTDIRKIMEFMEVKDLSRALKNETPESKEKSEMWINAMSCRDTYLTYKSFWDFSMFHEVLSNIRKKDVVYYIQHPYNVPIEFQNHLLERGREKFLASYEELNEYYRMLNGLPPLNTPKSEYIYLTEPMRNQLHATDDPVHLLSPLIQNSYMSTDEYKTIVKNHPDKEYLRYLGLYKIDIYTARKANDFEIIRYPSSKSDINPNLLNVFRSLYIDYREYVMSTLYNSNFESMYENYRSFMGLIINSFVLLQIANKSLESIHDRNFLDDTMLHMMLSIYDIPDNLLMTNEVRRNLTIHILKLVRNKGTDDIYYDLIKILGYQDVIVSKLLLAKGQIFSGDHYHTSFQDGNPIESLKDLDQSEKHLNVDPYFIQVDLQDKNPYDTITSGNARTYDYHEIIDQDPTWWDLPDVQDIIKNSNYSISESKYIVIEAIIYQMKYLFESIYFTKLIMDNKNPTDHFFIEIPEIFGTEKVSIFDIMIFLIAATCINHGMSGEIISEENKLICAAGFNFNIDLDSFTEFVNQTKYVDKNRLMDFMKNLTIQTPADINRLYHEVMYPMREWLEYNIANASNRYEYIEYESIYRALYTYDATQNTLQNDFKPPLEIICEKFHLSEDDLIAYQHFYPRTMHGSKVTIEEYENSRYKYPFLSRKQPIDFFIHLIIETVYGEDDRGIVYFHDILNCQDLRELTNPDGTRVFMDYEDEEKGWEINQQAVDKLLELIDQIDDEQLNSAYFQVNTPILNSGGKLYQEGELLPPNIRSGIFKEILKEKIIMDMQGLAKPPATYLEYLYRKNIKLYNLLTEGDRFITDKESWLNDILKIVLILESELNIHMKYFEQSVVGSELFFQPLITLINRFKSNLVDFAKTGLRYVFGDKIDSGGNSNMFKLFDEVDFVIHFVTLKNKGYESQFGLYDTEHAMKYYIELKDRSEMIQEIEDGYHVNPRDYSMGSIRMVDEVKLFKNGKEIDPNDHSSIWYSGEPGTGRWSEEDDILMRIRKENARVSNPPIDLNGWKDFIISYSEV